VLPYAVRRKIPLIIGTAGGSGGNVHVEWMKKIIEEIAEEHGLSIRMAIIESEVTKEYVKDKLRAGKVKNIGPGLELTEEVIDRCNRIVSQIGVDPYLKAMESDVDVILAGRSCDTAIFAAPAIKAGMDWGLAFHMAKIIECGALCSVPMAAADMIVADIEKDSFTLEPVNPARRCTIERVAAHTMYEQTNPYYIYEPDGVIDLKESKYEQISDRAVRISNSEFTEANVKTLKLEGSMLAGYRTITIAGINDPETIKHVDNIFSQVKEFIARNMEGKILPEDYSIILRKYGTALSGSVPQGVPCCNMGIIVDVVAKTQDIANTICALARSRLLHTDYEGRKSTAGNLAFPYSPSDIVCGPVYTFGIYHLVEVDDLCETSSIKYIKVGE